MRRDVRRHPDSDPRRAVDEQVGNCRGQKFRFRSLTVEVFLEVHRLFVDIGKDGFSNRRHARFGVAVGRRRVAVYRTEIALTVDELVTQRPVLRHPHHRVVDRSVTVRVILFDDLADDPRRFGIFAVAEQAFLLHRVQDAALHRLETVAYVG